jgi:hypothetical protein
MTSVSKIVVSFSCVYSSMIYDLCILETLVIVVSFSCVYSSMIYDL